jgi:hypothetical protein
VGKQGEGVKPPENIPRDPDPYYAFDESWGPSMPRRKRIKRRRPFPLAAVLVAVLVLVALLILGSYLAGGALSLVGR